MELLVLYTVLIIIAAILFIMDKFKPFGYNLRNTT